MSWIYIVVVITAVGVTASAAYALYWSAKNGQFQQLNKGATSIFDDEEPMGVMTDTFPGKDRVRAARDPKLNHSKSQGTKA